MKRKISLIALIGIIFGLNIQAAEQTQTMRNSIRSLRVRYAYEAESSDRQDPVRAYLTLPAEGVIDGSDNQNTLEISFDELSHNIYQYAYKVRHLTANYLPDELETFEYIRGFTRGEITDYGTSLNTSVDYTHYSFRFPNEDMQLTVSGNYEIMIYDADRGEDAVVATVVFPVLEPQVTIAASVTPNTIREISGHYQQVDIEVNTRSLHMVNPTDIKLMVRQNGRLDNQVFAPYPTYIETNRLRWKDHKQLVFEGGNEYRHLDIWSTYFAGMNVDKIRHDGTDYHAFLFADRFVSNYMHEFDHNGQWVINAERCTDIDTEAEYMYVHWTLPMGNPIFDGTLYVGGELFNNKLEPTLNRMIYDNEHRCYYFNTLLKQGGYDYQYWLKKKGEPSATLLRTEGSYWQTENAYTVYVYFRSVSDRYDRLVGLYTSSSSM